VEGRSTVEDRRLRSSYVPANVPVRLCFVIMGHAFDPSGVFIYTTLFHIVYGSLKAKFHYTDPTRTGHGQSPRTLSSTI